MADHQPQGHPSKDPESFWWFRRIDAKRVERKAEDTYIAIAALSLSNNDSPPWSRRWRGSGEAEGE
jgi:hypothetical protein